MAYLIEHVFCSDADTGSTLDGTTLSDTFSDVAPPARVDAEVQYDLTLTLSIIHGYFWDVERAVRSSQDVGDSDETVLA